MAKHRSLVINILPKMLEESKRLRSCYLSLGERVWIQSIEHTKYSM